MSNGASQELVAEVTREIVEARFPEELPHFRAQSRAYFEDPRRSLEGSGSGDNMLGFGGGEAVAMVTPVALAVVSEVVTYLLEEVKEAVKSEGETAVESNIRHLFKRLDPAEREKKKKEQRKSESIDRAEAKVEAPTQTAEGGRTDSPGDALTPDQINAVRTRALEKALALELPEQKAELLADALAGSLRGA